MRVVCRTFAVLGGFAISQFCGAANAVPADNVKAEQNLASLLDGVESVAIDKDEHLDVRALLAQISSVVAANADRVNGVNIEDLKISMFQAKFFERLLFAAAKKLNLHTMPELLERRDDFFRQLVVRSYVSKNMSDRIKPADIQKLYEDLIKSYPKPGIEIGHILVKEENTAKEVIAALERGEKFADLAKKYSIASSKDQGGKEDLIPVEALPPQMAELKNLEIGQHAKNAFPSEAGFHIVCVLDKRNVEAPKLEQVQRSLEAELFRTELEKLTQTLLKTVNIVAKNSSGKDVDIMPILTKKIIPTSQQPAQSVEAKPTAPKVEEVKSPPTEEVSKPVETVTSDNELKKKSDNVETGALDVADPDENVGLLEKLFRWIKSFF